MIAFSRVSFGVKVVSSRVKVKLSTDLNLKFKSTMLNLYIIIIILYNIYFR